MTAMVTPLDLVRHMFTDEATTIEWVLFVILVGVCLIWIAAIGEVIVGSVIDLVRMARRSGSLNR